jgi:soluble lytic murein transglycosylase-like protein
MTAYRALIETLAARFALDADWLDAQVVVESAGHTDAFRYEAGIAAQLAAGRLRPTRDLAGYVPRRVASSYGLLQILFVTALDYGYTGEPEGLFDPEAGLLHGCLHLRRLLSHAGGDRASALATYNGGAHGNEPGTVPKRNQAYVEKVTAAHAAILKARAT